MAYNICGPVNGQTKLGPFENIIAQTFLQETAINSGQFQLQINYQATGLHSASGTQSVPVNGNASGTVDAGPATINYSIANWNLTATTLSFTLTAAISAGPFGPDTIYDNALFSGQLPQAQMKADAERIKKILDFIESAQKAHSLE